MTTSTKDEAISGAAGTECDLTALERSVQSALVVGPYLIEAGPSKVQQTIASLSNGKAIKWGCLSAYTRNSWGSLHQPGAATGSKKPFKKCFRRSTNAKGTSFLGQNFPEFSTGLVRTESLYFRLEKAIIDSKPPATHVDPTTTFWTVYKKVADEFDDDMVSKYVGNLDTSLIFVSEVTSLL